MRKTKNITITAEGRDKGKTFTITELPALQIERWAARALQGLTASGVDLPDDVAAGGGAALAAFGVKALSRIEFATLETLLAEMMGCVSYLFDPSKPMSSRSLVESDIEELSTLLLLRRDWFGVYFDFLLSAARSLMAPGDMVTGATAPSP